MKTVTTLYHVQMFKNRKWINKLEMGMKLTQGEMDSWKDLYPGEKLRLVRARYTATTTVVRPSKRRRA
jgi:hypothetical protein